MRIDNSVATMPNSCCMTHACMSQNDATLLLYNAASL